MEPLSGRFSVVWLWPLIQGARGAGINQRGNDLVLIEMLETFVFFYKKQASSIHVGWFFVPVESVLYTFDLDDLLKTYTAQL